MEQFPKPSFHVFITTDESFGTSTTNAIEELAMFVAEKFDIPLEQLICYEHYLQSGNLEKEITTE